jgi:hypothetical protein
MHDPPITGISTAMRYRHHSECVAVSGFACSALLLRSIEHGAISNTAALLTGPSWMGSHRTIPGVSRSPDDNDEVWLDRLPWGCAWFVIVPIAVAALVGASVIGNRVNNALPRGFGLVGILVMVCIMALVVSFLLSPTRTWRHIRNAFRRRP